MEVYKTREKSKQLKIYEFLDTRMKLSDAERKYYISLKKGYEGEKLFDSKIALLENDGYILNDLLLKTNNTHFQIDSIIIFSEIVHAFEVKNYEGEYYYKDERIYSSKSGLEITNPLNQLRKSEYLLRKLLHSLGFPLPISASVVFINPEFTLFEAPQNFPFLLPTQINRFLKQLNTQSSKLNERHKWLSNKLVSLHIGESPYIQLPNYSFDTLKKGITCLSCQSFLLEIVGQKCVCKYCGTIELLRNAIKRSIDEYKLLFPERKITTANIHDWCQIVESKRRIRKVLEDNFKVIHKRRWTYYE